MATIEHRSIILRHRDFADNTPWPQAMGDAGLTSLMLHACRLPDELDELLWFMRSDLGRDLHADLRGHGIALEYEMHTATWLLPRMWSHTKPEWFRMDRFGRRTSDRNFCFSNDEAWEVAEARLRTLAEALPCDTGRYLLFPDDVAEAACECPRCIGLSPSDQGMLYANRILRTLRRVRADATVSYLAYLGTLAPPERVLPDDGVFIEFAPIRRSYRYALDDPECAVNRQHLWALKHLLERLPGLPLHVTEYWLDAGLQSRRVVPHEKLAVPAEIIRRDVETYAELGATSITTYATGCDGEYWEHFGPPPLREYGEILAGVVD